MSETYRIRVAEDSRIKAEKIFAEQFKASIQSFLDRDVTVSYNGPFAFDYKEVKAAFPEEIVMCTIHTVDLTSGKSIFMMTKEDAGMIADLLNMGDGEASFVADEHLASIKDLFKEVTGAFYGEIAKNGGTHFLTDEVKAVVIDASPQDFLGSWSVSEFTLHLDRPATVLRVTQNELLDKLIPHSGDTKATMRPTVDADTIDPSLKREMGLVMDIELPISIELGRTQMLIRDIVKLAPGSVVELDKLSGEPVDLYVNNKRFARGEVVVIEENFAVRLTELINPEERYSASKN
ncbi:MAG: flagellar motor switch protein FliN [Calditrichaeota bacterium]|nr:flagellar motor switch protein FliN [Calditrichota bacterium]